MKSVYKHILGYLFLTNLIQAKKSTKKQKPKLKISLLVDDTVSGTNSEKKTKTLEFTTVEHCEIINNVADCPDSYFQNKDHVYSDPADKLIESGVYKISAWLRKQIQLWATLTETC